MALSIGVVLWERDPRLLSEKAAKLDVLGFASISVGDHLHPRAIAPLTACAIVAQATSHVQVGTLVLNNDFRHPVVLAREALALSDLSDGRFELGLGAGYARNEYERAGIEFLPLAIRAAQLGESAAILRRLFSGETVEVVGAYYSIQGETLPPSAHRVPLLIGGNSREVHEIAAANADVVGLIGLSTRRGGRVVDMSDFGSAVLQRQTTTLGELAGGRGSQLERHVLVQWHELTNDRQAAAERAAVGLDVSPETVLDSPYVLIGTPEEIAAQLRDHHRRFGIVRWTVFGDRPDLSPAKSLVPVLELLGQS